MKSEPNGTDQSKLIQTLRKGAIVRVLKHVKNGWEQVEATDVNDNKTRGYVDGKNLIPWTTPKSATSENASSEHSSSTQSLLSGSRAATDPTILAIFGKTITIKCPTAVGYVAPDGGQWDGHTTLKLAHGTMLFHATAYTQRKGRGHFYKANFGKETVYVRRSDVEGVDCNVATTEATASHAGNTFKQQQPFNQCPPGSIRGLSGTCYYRQQSHYYRPAYSYYHRYSAPYRSHGCTPIIGSLLMVCN